MNFQIYFVLILWSALVAHRTLCADVQRTDINTVNDNDRYSVRHPTATYSPFVRINHAKGNIIFTSGKRIDGDRLLLTFMDETQFGRLADIEVSLWYPGDGDDVRTLSYVEFVTDLSTSDAAAYFVNCAGIGYKNAEILIIANQTQKFGYQAYMYGY